MTTRKTIAYLTGLTLCISYLFSLAITNLPK